MPKNKVGRPEQPATQVIRVPVPALPAIEKLLGRSLADDQTPQVAIRVPVAQVAKIRLLIKSNG